MARPRVTLLWKNHGLHADTTWTASNSEATLPPRNLKTHVRGDIVRSIGTPSPWRVVANLGSAKAVEAVALIFDTRPTAYIPTTSATITIKSNTMDSWGSPADSFTLTPWDARNTGVLLAILGETWTRQYLAVEITDTGHALGYYELGVVSAGPLYEFPRSGRPTDRARFELVDPSPVSRAPSQTPHTEERRMFERLRLEWAHIPTEDVFGDLQTVLREVGKKRDGVLALHSDDPDADETARSLNIYGRFEDLPEFEYEDLAQGPSWNWGPVTFIGSR